MKLRRAGLYLLLTLSIFVVSSLVKLRNSLDPKGEADENCMLLDLGSVPNGAGLVANAHLTSCGYFIAHGGETTYVYVHRVGEPDERESLVFRFDTTENGQPPQLVWTDNQTLHITFSRVAEVRKELSSIGTVKISYSIGEEEIARGESAKLARRVAAILSAVLMFLIGICVLTARSLLRQKNRTS
jgi:hypothetical protein